MLSSDPIADLLTRIRNGGMAKLRTIHVPSSRTKKEIASLLQRAGYLNGVSEKAGEKGPVLVLDLRYDSENCSVVHEIRRVSKPGRRVYVSRAEIPRVKSGMGMCVLSTSRGILSDAQARESGVGGELICEVW